MTSGTYQRPPMGNAPARAEMESAHDDAKAETRKTVRDRNAAYRLVDIRDAGNCRACSTRTLIAPAFDQRDKKREHHHVRGRQVKDAETTGNICLLCKSCHDLRHTKRTLVIVGNADQLLTFEQDGKVWHA